MTKDALIARQALQLAEADERNAHLLACIKAARLHIIQAMPGGGGEQSHFVPFRCDGGDPKVAGIFQTAPWMHSRPATPEEVARLTK